MILSYAFKLLGKVDATVWGCFVQLAVLVAIIGSALAIIIVSIAEK